MEDLTLIQKEIVFELEYLKEKSLITEKFLAKKVREHAKIQGKSKAGICLNDLEICLGYLSEQKQLNFYILRQKFIIKSLLSPLFQPESMLLLQAGHFLFC